MSASNQVIIEARNAAEKHIDKAQGELVDAARQIAKNYNLPDGINGLSAAEFLGRLSFVTSMSRDIRRAGAEAIGKELIKHKFESGATPAPMNPAEALAAKAPPKDDTPPAVSDSVAIDELQINPMTIKALKGAGLHTIQDVNRYTDEALLAVKGIAPPSLSKLRAAIDVYPAALEE